MKITISKTVAVVLAAAMFAISPPAVTAATIMKADSGATGNIVHAMMVVYAKLFSQHLDISVQINDSQTLTRSAIKLGRDQIDMMPLPPAIWGMMRRGKGPYRSEQMKKAARKGSGNIRSVMGYNANLYHAVTFASTGIKDWKDIKGKRVFTGPPSGAAAIMSELMINIITGYKAKKDYKAIRLPWGSGLQAMMDGKLDVYVRPAAVGSASIVLLGSRKKFRLLGTTKELVNSKAWERYSKRPGRTTGLIPANTYPGQLGGDVITGGATFMFVIRKSLSDDLAYKMTKVIWENIDEIHKSAAVLKEIKKETPFIGVNAPLHKGAIRYYREAGVKIPTRLIPPEAK
jgi:TRAP transporter TAXI family solute receptor